MSRFARGALSDKVLSIYKCAALTVIAFLLIASLGVLASLEQKLDSLQHSLTDTGPFSSLGSRGIPVHVTGGDLDVHVTGGELEVGGEVDVGNWYMFR